MKPPVVLLGLVLLLDITLGAEGKTNRLMTKITQLLQSYQYK